MSTGKPTARATGRPPGRPCAVCGSANRAAIEAAARRGAPLRWLERDSGISARAIGRHMANHPKLPAAKPVRASAESVPLLLDASGNITVDAFGRPIVNGHGTSPPVLAQSELKHPIRWWRPTAPDPRPGARCERCCGNEWWRVSGWWGGCAKCWGGPAIVDGRKSYFTT